MCSLMCYVGCIRGVDTRAHDPNWGRLEKLSWTEDLLGQTSASDNCPSMTSATDQWLWMTSATDQWLRMTSATDQWLWITSATDQWLWMTSANDHLFWTTSAADQQSERRSELCGIGIIILRSRWLWGRMADWLGLTTRSVCNLVLAPGAATNPRDSIRRAGRGLLLSGFGITVKHGYKGHLSTENLRTQAVVDCIDWAFRRLKKRRSREMSARGYELHSVCPQFSFFFF